MGITLKNGQWIEDRWQLVDSLEEPVEQQLEQAPRIWPVDIWRNQRDQLLRHGGEIGVWISGEDDPALLAADMYRFNIIAIRFPSFTDGRGFSLAKILREHYAYPGELRAFGQILEDQTGYLAQCGFDTFYFQPGNSK